MGRSCGWNEQPPAGQGPSAVERVLCGSGPLTVPHHPQDILEGSFKEEGQGGGYLKGKVSVLRVFSSCLSGWAVGDGDLFLCSGEGTDTPALIRTCLSCSFTSACTEMPLGSALLPGGVCTAELSTQPAWGTPHGAAGRSCGWKEGVPPGTARQGPALERLLCGSGLPTAPD